ncbi:MAG: filamentous hemagglutinin N-terminal domain-containing protein [Cyanobacteria bacterium P01_D01_bin.105]
MFVRFGIFLATLGSFEIAAKGDQLRIYPDDTTQTSITGGIACSSDCNISGGMRIGDGLFHSFREFSIPENTTATFSDGGATNIFARVSEVVSIINGELAVTGAGKANFFLINPNGITFGANSSLSLQGSFLATTAESILFPNEVEFSAGEREVPMLSVTAPIGLQFGATSNPIVNQSQVSLGLQVRPRETLALFGGGVELNNGNIAANSGQVLIGSLGANSRVLLSPELIPKYDPGTRFQDISLTQSSNIVTNGSGGQVLLQGQNISILDRSFILNTAFGSSTVGNIGLFADETIAISGLGISFSSLPSATVGTNFSLESKRLLLEDGAVIVGGTLGDSDGGSITINATESVELTGSSDFVPSLITTSTEGDGSGGNINISTGRLSITDGGQIQAAAFSSGKGGDINITANERIDISDTNTTLLGAFASGIVASSGLEFSTFFPSGEGGNLTINTDTLTLNNGAEVAVNSFGTGDSGDTEINARSVQLNDSSQITAAAAFGNGGNIRLNGLETLVLRRGSSISTQAGTQGDDGNGGNIDINADFIVTELFEDSDIVANARQGNGGNITINTQGLYGISERRAIANNGTNDIDASSEFGISGTLAINRVFSEADTAPTILTRETAEESTEVSQACGSAGNRFLLTGRGGIPMQPNGIPEIRASLVDLGDMQIGNNIVSSSDTEKIAREISTPVLIEANGWYRDNNNQIKLLAQAQQENISFDSAAHCASS